MKKITILMLTYNHEKYIFQAIESILKQKTNYELEILIGDDCSPDKTTDILNSYQRKYPEKIKLIIREQNIGPRENFLDLLSKANGDYIALLEGDDYWISENKIEELVNFLEFNEKDYIGAFHNIQVVDFEGKIKINHEYNKNKKFMDIKTLEEHYDGKIMMTLSMVFRNIFKDKKEYTEYKNMLDEIKYVCDYSLKAYLLNLGKFKYFENILGAYRHVDTMGTSWSAQSQIIKNEDFLLIYKKNIDVFGEIAEKKLGLNYFILFVKNSLFYLKNGELDKLKKILKEFNYKILLNQNIYRNLTKKIIKRIKNAK
ncbi:MAG: glycosyltransferase [Cetobacterium sp.]